jgi:flagellar hook-length control protein FliK
MQPASTAIAVAGADAAVHELLKDSSDAGSAHDPEVTMRVAETGMPVAVNEGSRTTEVSPRTISVPVQHPRWAEAVSSEIRWFAEQGVQNATLRLTPEHLGPVEVRLSLSDSQVTVNFAAASAETRAALELSLPRLREMLAGAGLSLGEAQVQQQMRQGSQNPLNRGGPEADSDLRDSLAAVPMRLGLVDEYA